MSIVHAPRKLCEGRPILHQTHFGHPVVVEAERITVARVPAQGPLHMCVLVHPRYVEGPEKVDHTIIYARGRRYGRSIDVLLEEPFEFEGKQYEILNFKGIGADADREMVIRPSLWFYLGLGDFHEQWVETNSNWGDPFGRLWGALRSREAETECEDLLLPSFGIPQIPHITANLFSDSLNRNIWIKEGKVGPTQPEFGQLVRACDTNMRIDEAKESNLELETAPDSIRRIAAIDAAVMFAQARLGVEGKTLSLVGEVDENRFVDGRFTDAENYQVTPCRMTRSDFLGDVIASSLDIVELYSRLSQGSYRELHEIYHHALNEEFQRISGLVDVDIRFHILNGDLIQNIKGAVERTMSYLSVIAQSLATVETF